MVTKNGIFGYEGDTFKQAIEKIKVRYKVKRVVIVADGC
jgi:hypothetical protein